MLPDSCPDDGLDADEIEELVGPQLISRLYGLFRAVRIYDSANQTVRDQLDQLLGILGQTMEQDYELVLVAMGQCFYVNGVRIRAEASQVPFFDSLSKEFEQRRLGGVRFVNGVTTDQLGAFFRLMLDHPDAGRAARLGEALAGAGVSHVAPITMDELEALQQEMDIEEEDVDRSERGRAKETFWRSVRGAKSAILRTARTGKPAVRRLKRLVQPIVDTVMKNEYSLVGLTAIKDHDEYTYAHCVNVSIISIAIGQVLGLSRASLANLGLAGLLHDIGKIEVPASVLSKPGKLTDEEWTLMQRHPIEGVKVVSRMPGLSTLTRDSLRVCLQHHLPYDHQGGYPNIQGEWRLSTLSRIVSAADCFDALTSHRTYRARPFTGHEAVWQLVGPDRSRFDPAVLWGLIKAVGLYPAGTMMHTHSGYLVLSLSSNPEDIHRPHCRVLARPDGSMPSDSQPEMWQPMPHTESVARIVPPEEYDVSVDRLLAA